MPESVPLTRKAEQTRAAIAEAAMRLFLRDGYDRTTMRAIATEAGVSVGNAYYYFGSKEHLIQAFYDRMLIDHETAAIAAMAGTTSFADRLEATLLAWLDVAETSHAFASQFYRFAADPSSPLSPFSPESAAAREGSIALFARLLDGSDVRVSKSLRAELPELLWLLQMGLVLFWVYDDSEHQARSRVLATTIAPMIDRLVRTSRLPVIRGLVEDLLEMLATLRSA